MKTAISIYLYTHVCMCGDCGIFICILIDYRLPSIPRSIVRLNIFWNWQTRGGTTIFSYSRAPRIYLFDYSIFGSIQLTITDWMKQSIMFMHYAHSLRKLHCNALRVHTVPTYYMQFRCIIALIDAMRQDCNMGGCVVYSAGNTKWYARL
jgi:hypothetical protein